MFLWLFSLRKVKKAVRRLICFASKITEEGKARTNGRGDEPEGLQLSIPFRLRRPQMFFVNGRVSWPSSVFR